MQSITVSIESYIGLWSLDLSIALRAQEYMGASAQVFEYDDDFTQSVKLPSVSTEGMR